jgi:hypothetical protein
MPSPSPVYLLYGTIPLPSSTSLLPGRTPMMLRTKGSAGYQLLDRCSRIEHSLTLLHHARSHHTELDLQSCSIEI